MIFAVELFGRELPSSSVGLFVIAAMVVIFLFSRVSPGSAGGARARTEGHGRLYQCTRCGRDFHAEQTEHLPDGRERHIVNDRCPNCGWDLDWGNADDPDNPMRNW